jgi:hypothetical protein
MGLSRNEERFGRISLGSEESVPPNGGANKEREGRRFRMNLLNVGRKPLPLWPTRLRGYLRRDER